MEERKSNKKTRIVIIASMLLLLIAIACLCGTTFARYITKQEVPSTTATVAQWGFVVKADTKDFLGTDYTKTAGDTATKVNADGVAVAAAATAVAPGTSGSIVFGVEGSAEVLAEVVIAKVGDLQEITLTDTKNGDTVVHTPITWEVAKGTAEDSINAAAPDHKNLSLTNAFTKFETPANTYINAGDSSTIGWYKLTWTWALDDAANTNKDKYDTYLGFAAQGADDYYDNGKKIVVAAGTKDGEMTIKVYEKAADNAAADTKDAEGYSTTASEEYTAQTQMKLGLKVEVKQVLEKAA